VRLSVCLYVHCLSIHLSKPTKKSGCVSCLPVLFGHRSLTASLSQMGEGYPSSSLPDALEQHLCTSNLSGATCRHRHHGPGHVPHGGAVHILLHPLQVCVLTAAITVAANLLAPTLAAHACHPPSSSCDPSAFLIFFLMHAAPVFKSYTPPNIFLPFFLCTPPPPSSRTPNPFFYSFFSYSCHPRLLKYL
jgi:hypothetical protein